MSVEDLITEPVRGTGKGIVAGGETGSKVAGTVGAFAGGLGAIVPSILIGGVIALLGAFTAPALLFGTAVAAVGVTLGVVAGGAGGFLGGGLFGASAGGFMGFIHGLFRGVDKSSQPTPEQQMQSLRMQSAASNNQLAQAEMYLQMQQQKQAEMEAIKQQRAAVVETVANPEKAVAAPEQPQAASAQPAPSNEQLAQMEMYLKEQQQKLAEMDTVKQQRAAAQESVANPEASDKNAAKVTATATAQASVSVDKSLSV